ncbi:hypothetical protein LOK49_LG06G02512 [Camellia lanceoleosa]|uniref:Uncharacterized protein n=1 Tax=Camellia lanceoleosa TaxID=1840588 RepID=A0ACC0HGQ0_9ERIC|nr:hypothetical protein LOK49_LG06G02512 [Camellia lanceoleosa]
MYSARRLMIVVRKALASERELVLALLDPDAVVDTGPTARRFSSKGKKSDFDPVISALLDPIIQICEQAAEAHKSKGLHFYGLFGMVTSFHFYGLFGRSTTVSDIETATGATGGVSKG